MAKENENQQFQQPQIPQKQEQLKFKIGWLLVPISLFGMYWLLSNIRPVLKWDDVMNILHVHNKERYTSLGILCVIIICIVAITKITGTKEK